MGRTRIFISVFLFIYPYSAFDQLYQAAFQFLKSWVLDLDSALIKSFSSCPGRQGCCVATIIAVCLYDLLAFKSENSLGKQSLPTL